MQRTQSEQEEDDERESMELHQDAESPMEGLQTGQSGDIKIWTK
jgi:hypothetical protein